MSDVIIRHQGAVEMLSCCGCPSRAGISFKGGDGPSFLLETLSTNSHDRPVVTMDTASRGRTRTDPLHTHTHTYVIWLKYCCEIWRPLTSEQACWALNTLFNRRRCVNVYERWINEAGCCPVALIQSQTPDPYFHFVSYSLLCSDVYKQGRLIVAP